LTSRGLRALIIVSILLMKLTPVSAQLLFPKEIRSVVEAEAKALDVPLALVWTIGHCESGFKKGVVNHNTNGTYDVGYFQLNSQYHEYFGWKFYRKEGFNPENQIHNAIVAVRYMAHLYKQFGSWYLVMLAYNVGPSFKDVSPESYQRAATRYRMYLGLQFPDDRVLVARIAERL